MSSRKEGGLGWMIFDNPERHNAIDPSMWSGMLDILAEFEADAGIRACVMTGAGDRAFVSGADIGQFPDDSQRLEASERGGGVAVRALEALGAFPKPLIAMVRGWCLGAGVAVALKADFRVAASDIRIGIPAARLGVGYPFDAVRDLVTLVGPGTAKLVLFSAERMGAEAALRVGLVDEVVAPDALEERVRELSSEICQNAPLSILAAKASVDQIAREPNTRAGPEHLIKACFASADFQEGRAAFLEKRPPVFQGR
jgi:enoyl-CoA hydratase/carnithine racemase